MHETYPTFGAFRSSEGGFEEEGCRFREKMGADLSLSVNGCPLGVFFAHNIDRTRPIDVDRRVVPADAAFVATLIGAAHVIEEHRVVRSDEKTVRELLRNVEHLEVLGGEFDAKPLAIGRGVRAHIDDAIEDRPCNATNGLGFAIGRVLPVKATKRSRGQGLGHVGLGDRGVQAVRFELVVRPGTSEEAPLVDDWLEVDHIRASQRRLFEDHDLSVEDRCQPGWLLLGMVNSMSANLMVTDVAKSLAFYADGLGGSIAFTVDADQNSNMEGEVIDGAIFASVRLGESEMMLQDRVNLAEDAPHAFSASDTPGGTFSMYFRVDDVEAVLARLGDVEIVKPLQMTWYGMNEVWVRDPDGYVVTIGTPTGPPPEV